MTDDYGHGNAADCLRAVEQQIADALAREPRNDRLLRSLRRERTSWRNALGLKGRAPRIAQAEACPPTPSPHDG